MSNLSIFQTSKTKNCKQYSITMTNHFPVDLGRPKLLMNDYTISTLKGDDCFGYFGKIRRTLNSLQLEGWGRSLPRS